MKKIFIYLGFAVLSCTLAAASWPTFGGDPQRSGWAKDEATISPETVKGYQMLWHLKLDNEPKQLNSLTPPVVINPVYTNHGAQTYVVVGGSSDNLYVVDADSGKLVWAKHFTNGQPPSTAPMTGTYFCPDSLNDTPVISNSDAGPTVYVISIDGKLHALNLVNGEDRFPPRSVRACLLQELEPEHRRQRALYNDLTELRSSQIRCVGDGLVWK